MVILALELPSVVPAERLIEIVTQNYPKGVVSFPHDCLRSKPSDRPTAKELLRRIEEATGQVSSSRSSSVSDAAYEESIVAPLPLERGLQQPQPQAQAQPQTQTQTQTQPQSQASQALPALVPEQPLQAVMTPRGGGGFVARLLFGTARGPDSARKAPDSARRLNESSKREL
jgi:hypothetical protein